MALTEHDRRVHRGEAADGCEDGQRLAVVLAEVEVVREELIVLGSQLVLVLRREDLGAARRGHLLRLAPEELQAFEHVHRVDDGAGQQRTIHVEHAPHVHGVLERRVGLEPVEGDVVERKRGEQQVEDEIEQVGLVEVGACSHDETLFGRMRTRCQQ